MCMQVNMCQSLRVAEAAAALPVALTFCKPKGFKAEHAKQIYLLDSCKLEANRQNKDTDRTLFKCS